MPFIGTPEIEAKSPPMTTSEPVAHTADTESSMPGPLKPVHVWEASSVRTAPKDPSAT